MFTYQSSGNVAMRIIRDAVEIQCVEHPGIHPGPYGPRVLFDRGLRSLGDLVDHGGRVISANQRARRRQTGPVLVYQPGHDSAWAAAVVQDPVRTPERSESIEAFKDGTDRPQIGALGDSLVRRCECIPVAGFSCANTWSARHGGVADHAIIGNRQREKAPWITILGVICIS